jgi:hypothetical protein
MPPYPLYGETAIPGTATSEPPAASNTSGLHTHSSKFPVSSSYSVNPVQFTVTNLLADHFYVIQHHTSILQVAAQSLSHRISLFLLSFYHLFFHITVQILLAIAEDISPRNNASDFYLEGTLFTS